jgi:hypothetical protein
MKKSLHLFAQLAKIDESRHEVWGVATAEMVDKEGEIFDYSSSKPYFKAWSDEIAKATDGKSLGNVREMHEPSAVGKLVALEFDDELKQVCVGAKIIDDRAWQKCTEGVYTGFSIGGQYVKAWKDGEYVRFTANPAEISVVDNPCVPGAHFTAVKADGQIEIRKFAMTKEDLGKAGARHSAETRAHHDAIDKCLGNIAKAAADAQDHCAALADKDESGAQRYARAQVHKHSAETPEIQTGELQMLDPREKEQLERARADSASSLSKIEEVEEVVTEMKKGQEQIAASIANLTKIIGKMAGIDESGAAVHKVHRAATPQFITKEQDNGAGVTDLSRLKPEERLHEEMKKALMNPVVSQEQPGFYRSAR